MNLVNLVEEKPKGIISIMDEECLRPGETSDVTFLCKMDAKTRKSIQRYEFRLRHYADEITYSVHGFLEKNNDLLLCVLKYRYKIYTLI